MALIAVASAKGAPGVSTTALAIAAVWPRRSLLAEVDESGGDLVYRHAADSSQPLDPRIGMLSLALAGRRGLPPAVVWEHTQRLNGGQETLLGLASPEQATAWQGMWPLLGRSLAALGDSDVIADLGRIGPKSGPVDMLPMASLILLVARTTTEEIAALRERIAALGARLSPNGTGGPPIGVLLVGPKREHAKVTADVNQLLLRQQLPAFVLGCLPLDTSGAAQLAGRKGGRVEKSELMRAARQITAAVASRYRLASTEQANVTQVVSR
ncbi:hypothetical protein [Kitasatospora sp. NPDC093679]|uniref:hypothetical protein n=1 Tax=Kitasatospora sp. NPDC093679 TaxID=3154983 RepID=UPI00344A04AB